MHSFLISIYFLSLIDGSLKKSDLSIL